MTACLLWVHDIEGLATEQDRDEAICGQCNFSNFARLCLTDMNIPTLPPAAPVRHRLLGEHRHPSEMGTGNLRHRHQPPKPVLRPAGGRCAGSAALL